MALRLAFTHLRTASRARLLAASAAPSSALRSSVSARPHQIARSPQRRCLATGSASSTGSSRGPAMTTGATKPASAADASTSSGSNASGSASAPTFATDSAEKRSEFAAHFNDAHFRDALRGFMQFYYSKPAPQLVGVGCALCFSL